MRELLVLLWQQPQDKNTLLICASGLNYKTQIDSKNFFKTL